MNRIWRDIPIGTIVDADIVRLACAGELIVEGFGEKCVKQACYELRASDIFYEVQRPSEEKRVVVSAGEKYLLKPHCYVVSIVQERIRLPENVLGRILTKGRLFSVGILPVNTYADPGFDGRLGITLYNGSHRYIVIQPGEPVAKIEFTVLPKPVERPYSGQHGYDTEIWPVATHLYAQLSDREIAAKIGSTEEELELSYGPRIASMARQLRFYQQGVWVHLAVITCCFAAIFALYGQLSLFGSVVIGVLSNLLTAGLVKLFANRVR